MNKPELGSVTADGAFTAIVEGGPGELTIQVTNLGFAKNVSVSLDVFTPKPVATLKLPAKPGELAVSGDRLVVAIGESVHVANISVPEAPLLAGQVALGATVQGVDIAGPLAVAAAGEQGLAVLDVSDLAAPKYIARIPLPANARAVAMGKGRAYVGTDGGLVVVDLSQANAMSLVDADGDGQDDRIMTIAQPGTAITSVDRTLGQVVCGTTLGFVTAFSEGSDAAPLAFEGSVGVGSEPDDVLSAGGYAYAALGSAGIAQISLSTVPATVSATVDGFVARHVAAHGDAILGGMAQTANLVTFFSTSSPGQLPVLGSINYSGMGGGTNAFGLDVQGGYHYISGNGNAILVGQHELFVDLLGVPPVVKPIAPSPGVVLDEGQTVPFTVVASDDVKVASVELSVDGEVIATLDKPPWTAGLTLPDVSADTTLTLSAKAFDLGGNVGELEPYEITVQPIIDLIPPKVAFLTPTDGQAVGGNTSLPVEVVTVDDHGVVKVEYLLDGEVVVETSTPPFDGVVTIPAVANNPEKTVALEARATDVGGNIASATLTLIHVGVDLVAQGVLAIPAGDSTYDGADILVQGGTVIVDGVHSFGALNVGDGGALTHSQTPGGGAVPFMDITADSITVAEGGTIVSTGKGFLGDCAPGDPQCGQGAHGVGNTQPSGATQWTGGSHAGQGHSAGVSKLYGDFKAPTDAGGGGGFGAGGGEPGGNGGGIIKLTTEALVLEGVIASDGDVPLKKNQNNGSGGAGGSVWLDVGSLSGGGLVSAAGGRGGANNGGCGGGGRVAVYYADATEFDLSGVRAPGAALPNGAKPGAPGSVYLMEKGGEDTLIIDDEGLSKHREVPAIGTAPTGEPLVLGSLFVRGTTRFEIFDALEVGTLSIEDTARLTHNQTKAGAEPVGLTITATSVAIAAGARLTAVARGYLGDCATFAPKCGQGAHQLGNTQSGAAKQWSAGSHGGSGGGNTTNVTYGDPFAPTLLGAGGGFGAGAGEPGSNGGGRIKIVAQSLLVDGIVDASGGTPPASNQKNGSAGAGGSVWIDVAELSGVGQIRADGGPSGTNGGYGGGGGRVAVYYAAVDGFDLAGVSAYGGVGKANHGGPGTVLIQADGSPPLLRVNANGVKPQRAAPAWPEIGAGKTTAVTPDGITASGSPWKAGSLVGLELGFVGVEDTFTVVANTTNAITTDPADGDLTAVASVGARYTGTRTLQGTFLVDGLARVVILDHLTVDTLTVQGLSYLIQGQTNQSRQTAMILNVTDELTVDAGAYLWAQARGHLGDCASGDGACGTGADWPGGSNKGSKQWSGGSHGGVGGGTTPNAVYGSVFDPTTLGSGGGFGAGGGEPGGNGGGRVSITTPSLVLDGLLTVRGGNAVAQNQQNGGGGSGGSIHLDVGSLSGGGAINANGGDGGKNGGGGGGGGRIALYAGDASGFDVAKITAEGGLSTSTPGTPGSVFTGGEPGSEKLVLDDGGTSGGKDNPVFGPTSTGKPIVIQGTLEVKGSTRLVLYDDLQVETLILSDNAVITQPHTSPGLASDLTITATTITIGPNAALDVSRRGYLGDCAPGHGACGTGAYKNGNQKKGAKQWSGGSHGGTGSGSSPNPVYGSVAEPTEMGSGGGFGAGGGEPGGNGGGRVRVVATTLNLDGAIRANGGAALEWNQKNGSGGAGGSIWVTVDTLSGGGAITALGGASGSKGGAAGGGGRIAVNWKTLDGFDLAEVRAAGGPAKNLQGGGAGSVYLVEEGASPTWIIDDEGHSAHRDNNVFGPAATGEPLVLDGTLIVRGTSRLLLHDPIDVDTFILEEQAALTHPQTTTGFQADLVITAGTMSVSSGATVVVSARGYLGDCSPGDNACGQGAHTVGNSGKGASQYTGGSHGGIGSTAKGAPTRVYGDLFQPRTLGGGGGFGAGGGEPGGDGGGRVHITASTLTLDGTIVANGGGAAAQNQKNGGGGAGGSVLIDVDLLGGTGSISARGGGGTGVGGSTAGGGGRIAVYYGALDVAVPFDLTNNVDAAGGTGKVPAAAGTILAQLDGSSPSIRVSNGGVATATEGAPWVEVGLHKATGIGENSVSVAGSPWLPNELAGVRVGFAGTDQTFGIVSNGANSLQTDPADGDMTAVAAVGTQLHGLRVIDGDVLFDTGRLRLTDRVSVTNLTITAGTVITHPRATVKTEPFLHITALGTFQLDAAAFLSAPHRGYLGDCAGGDNACGQGAHTVGNNGKGAKQWSAGSYGGLGGGANANPTYGSPAAPFELGSGGGFGAGGGEPGGNGGGRVRIIADTIVVNGTIDANGGPGVAINQKNGSGGSGGAIWLSSTTLSGTGVLVATGGASGANGGAGAGGGHGRGPQEGGAGSMGQPAWGRKGYEGWRACPNAVAPATGSRAARPHAKNVSPRTGIPRARTPGRIASVTDAS